MDNPIQEPLTNNEEKQTEKSISSTPDMRNKYTKFKWIGVRVLAILILVGITVFAWVGFQNKGSNKNINTISNKKPEQTQNITPTPMPVDSSAWEMSLPKDEIKISNNQSENYLIYAVKNEYRSVVYKRNLQNGTQTKLFEFDKSIKADKNGNLWSGLPPSIALSSDKKALAFIDKEGLKVYDLQTKNTKTYIRKIEESLTKTEAPPKWSVDSLDRTYSLARLLWSSDDKYISFLQSRYEGVSFGMIDTESGAYIALKDVAGGYSDLSWSPVGRSYVKASSGRYVGNYEGSGLYVSTQSNIAQANNLAPKLGKTKDTPFLEANFSPDARRIVFTFEEPYDTKHLAIANSDGTGFMVVAEKIDVRMPFFSSDGNSVLYFQKRNDKQVLVKYDLVGKKSTDLIILSSEFNRWEKAYWTKDGFLALVGISSSSDLALGGDNTRMFVLDIANKKVIYTSPVFEQFTNFAGFSN